MEESLRSPSGLERHAQTSIQIIIVALIVWVGVELRELGKDMASMKMAQHMMLERLARVEAQARETHDDQLRMRERVYGREAR